MLTAGFSLAAALVVLAAAGAPAAAQDARGRVATPAVAIRTPPPQTPPEMAGSGIDPEVRLTVEIDDTGTVSRVDVLSIEPPSRFDDLVRSSLVRHLTRWRYGPARDAEDNPVASTMSWRMKVLSGEREGRRATGRFGVDAELRVLAGSDRMPVNYRPPTRQERAAALSGIVESAERYIDATHRRRRETPRFIVISDAEDESVVDALAGNMESVFAVFHSIFDEHVEPMPQDWKLVVYLFRRKASLEQLNRDVGGRPFSAGFYRSPGLLAFHQEVHHYDQLLGTMLHEAFHAFSDSHLTAPGKDLPRWAEEGLAEYFSHSKVERGRLIPGQLNQGRYAVAHGRTAGPVREQSKSFWSVREARLALRQGEAPSIVELLAATRDTFYGDRYQVFYGFSWLFTHFLLHGREAWADGEAFGDLLLYLTEEYPVLDALQAAYGERPENLQDEFDSYVRRF